MPTLNIVCQGNVSDFIEDLCDFFVFLFIANSIVCLMPSSVCTILARFFSRRQVLKNRRQMPEIRAKSVLVHAVTITQCELLKTRSERITDVSQRPVKYSAYYISGLELFHSSD